MPPDSQSHQPRRRRRIEVHPAIHGLVIDPLHDRVDIGEHPVGTETVNATHHFVELARTLRLAALKHDLANQVTDHWTISAATLSIFESYAATDSSSQSTACDFANTFGTNLDNTG